MFKKLALLIALTFALVCSAIPVQATITVAAHGFRPVTAGSTITLNTSGCSANCVGVVGIASYNGNLGMQTITDNLGNTWTRAGYITTGYDEEMMYYCINPIVGATHVITLGGFAGYSTFESAFFSGVNTGVAIVASNQNGAAGASGVSPGSVTPSGAGDLIVTSASNDSQYGSTPFAIDNSFAITDQWVPGDNSVRNGALAWKEAANASSINPAWTGNSGSNWDASILVFKGTAPPPPAALGRVNANVQN